MNRLYTLPFLLLPTFIIAQPTLTSAEMLGIGNTISMRTVLHFEDIDTTIQGTNAHWDFIALSEDLGQAPFAMTIVDPATTPHADLFPTANYAWRESPSNSYRYFDRTTSNMARVGSYTATSNIYDDPQIEYVFPLVPGVTSYDAWSTAGDEGHYGLTCVGSGTLDLPGGSYSALMVRAHVTGIIEDIPVYFWYSADNGAILVQYAIGDGFFTQTAGLFATSVGAGVDELTAAAGALVNNPVANDLVLTMPAAGNDLDYTVLSATGAVLHRGRLAAGTSTATIPVTDLVPGMYLLDLRSDRWDIAPSTLRFVKQ